MKVEPNYLAKTWSPSMHYVRSGSHEDRPRNYWSGTFLAALLHYRRANFSAINFGEFTIHTSRYCLLSFLPIDVSNDQHIA